MVAGVYKVQNIINGKIYIGSSVNINKRLGTHKYLLKRNKHHSYKLQGSFNKHGESAFIFEIVEEIYFPETYTKKLRNEYLQSIETYFIQKYDCCGKGGYNVSEIAGRPQPTKDSIRKGIETRRARGSYVISEESRKIRSKAIKNSELFKKGRAKAGKARRKYIYVYNLEGDFLFSCIGLKQCAEKTECYLGSINKCLNGYRFSCKGFRFYKDYIEDIEPLIKKEKKNRTFKTIIRKDLNGSIIKVYNDSNECSSTINKAKNTISDYITNKRNHWGYILEYGV